MQGRSDDWYLDGFLSEVDGLLTLKDDLIDPIQTFLQNNKQYGIYDTARYSSMSRPPRSTPPTPPRSRRSARRWRRRFSETTGCAGSNNCTIS